LSMSRPSARARLFPYTTLFRSIGEVTIAYAVGGRQAAAISTHTPAKSARYLPVPSASATSISANVVASTGSPNKCPCTKSQPSRSEEHTSELQSRENLVCRLLL